MKKVKILNYDLKFKNIMPLLNKHLIDKVILHCSATDAPHNVLNIHKWHLQNGWAGCGYHLFIKKNGSIQRGRPMEYVGSHCKGQNGVSFGVCLEGLKEFTKSQVNSFFDVVRYIYYYMNEKDLTWYPHRYFKRKGEKRKECPNLSLPQLFNKEIVVGEFKYTWLVDAKYIKKLEK